MTSFNEWHEGSQIEPASSNPAGGAGISDLRRRLRADRHGSSTAYLDRTKYWVDKFDPGSMAPSDVNLALGKTMTASGSQGGFPPGNANDNNTSSYWESSNNAFPQTLTVDLGSAVTVGRVVLKLPPSWGSRTQTLSVNGGASAGHVFDPAGGNSVTITVPPTSQRYLKLTFTGNTGWPAGQASEVEAYAS